MVALVVFLKDLFFGLRTSTDLVIGSFLCRRLLLTPESRAGVPIKLLD